MGRWISEERREANALCKEMKAIELEMDSVMGMLKGECTQKQWQASVDRYNGLSVKYESRSQRLEDLQKGNRKKEEEEED